MARYEITAPDGNRYEITAPDDASEEQVLSYAKQNYQSASPRQEVANRPDLNVMQPAHALRDYNGVKDDYQRVMSMLPSHLVESSRKWSELPGNIQESAMGLAKNMVQPILHPIETAKGLGNLAVGIAQKAIPGRQGSEDYADAAWKGITDRYGSLPAIKGTMINDPVGAMADVAGLASGGAGLLRTGGKMAVGMAPKAARAATRTGDIIGKVSSAVDPSLLMMKAPGAALRTVEPIASHTIGTVTGGGAMGLRELAKAGFGGGDAGRVAQQQLRGTSPIEGVVADAKNAISSMRKERSIKYVQDMAEIGKDIKPIKFDPIKAAVEDAKGIGAYKGKRIDASTGEVWNKIDEVVSDWEKSDPAEYHTPAGIDALKQAIGDIRDSTAYGTPSRVAADRVYHAIKIQVENQAPDYARAMKDYEQASNLIRDIENTLSVNPRANIDTTIRKLQSVMRNNVNTTYGRRVDLAKKLEEYGASNLMPALAGQAYSSVTPRGLHALGTTGAGIAALATNPAALPMLAITSPRLMGEAAYYGGKAASLMPRVTMAQPVAQGLLQSGRAANMQQRGLLGNR